MSAELTLPKGTVHIISDIHGEDRKLRHVINNASGTLRPFMPTLIAKPLPSAVRDAENETREKLVVAAENLFALHGYQG